MNYFKYNCAIEVFLIMENIFNTRGSIKRRFVKRKKFLFEGGIIRMKNNYRQMRSRYKLECTLFDSKQDQIN